GRRRRGGAVAGRDRRDAGQARALASRVMELLLIRHALPERIETPDGSPADPPLSAAGRAQAERMARWVSGEKVGAIYASPMRRARETAEALARVIGVEIVF